MVTNTFYSEGQWKMRSQDNVTQLEASISFFLKKKKNLGEAYQFIRSYYQESDYSDLICRGPREGFRSSNMGFFPLKQAYLVQPIYPLKRISNWRV